MLINHQNLGLSLHAKLISQNHQFLTYIYGQMGLNFSGKYGRAPTVIEIFTEGTFFHEVKDQDEAKIGDLIVHLKS